MAKKHYSERNLKFETLQLHVGQESPDPVTGFDAVSNGVFCGTLFSVPQLAQKNFSIVSSISLAVPHFLQ